MQKSKTFPLKEALAVAEEIADLIRPACIAVHIAGSVRRRATRVHDVDLVAQARYNRVEAPGLFDDGHVKHAPVLLKAALGGIASFPDDAKIIRFVSGGIPVDVYLSEPDGSNLGALLQMRTGSAGHNIQLAQRAMLAGLQYRAGYGIYKDGQRVDDGSESGIYKALGWTCPPPEKRS